MASQVDRAETKRLVAKLVNASGCTCCRDIEVWDEALNELGEMLGVKKYADGSGYDFWSLRTNTGSEK